FAQTLRRFVPKESGNVPEVVKGQKIAVGSCSTCHNLGNAGGQVGTPWAVIAAAADPACSLDCFCRFRPEASFEQLQSRVVYEKSACEAPAEIQTSYWAAQAAEQSDRHGLWQDPDPVPPWEWRKEKRTMTRFQLVSWLLIGCCSTIAAFTDL